MVLCCAYNCNSRTGQGIGMFSFPKNPSLRKIWTEKLKRKDFVPTDFSKICEKHFLETDFKVSREFAKSIGFELKSLQLKNDAVPSVFNPKPQETQKRRHRSTSAVNKRRRLEVMQDVLYQSTCTTNQDTTTQEEIRSKNQEENMVVEPPDCILHDDSYQRESVADSAPKQTFSESTQTPKYLVKMRHVKMQTDAIADHVTQQKVLRTIGTQTEVTQTCRESDLNQSFSTVISLDNSFDSDVTWKPGDDEKSDDEDDDVTLAKERKFIIFESQLDILLRRDCALCGRPLTGLNKKVRGSGLFVSSKCSCGNVFSWESQPASGNMPLGNLLMAGAILFSGGNPCKALNIFKHMSVQAISERTFFLIQQMYLVPTIENVYTTRQNELIQDILNRGVPVRLGGDGRCCSPGHTAKFGTYSMMDLTTNKILDIKLVQTNEVTNSYRMEMEGLLRCLIYLEGEGIEISHLVTDRHSQIKKYMREERPDITHWFDVWHVAKGIYKKLVAAGKKRGCEKVGEWAQSISNHMYWCAASADGDHETLYQKWVSVLNRITDQHEGHGDKYPAYQHGVLEDRLWLKKGYKPFDEVEKVVAQKQLLKDIRKLSPAEQTSSLESFHKIVCHFAPKFVHFQHAQMEARMYLAALHFNENSDRPQAVNRNGDPIYAVSYPKSRSGEGVSKEKKVQQTFDYVDDLMEDLVFRREVNYSYTKAKKNCLVRDRPPPLSADAEKTPKSDIVQRHVHRFNR